MSNVRQMNDELRAMSQQQLLEKLEAWEKDLFLLRLNAVAAHVKDYSQFKKLRANIARAKTYLQLSR